MARDVFVRPETIRAESRATYARLRASGKNIAAVLGELIDALSSVQNFDERRQVLRWLCDFYGIDPTRLI